MQPGLLTPSLPDPKPPKPREEKDEPSASDRRYDTRDYVPDALRPVLEPLGHYVRHDRRLRMDPEGHDDRLLLDLLVALDVPPGRRDPDVCVPWVVGKAPDAFGEPLSPSPERADLERSCDGFARRWSAVGERARRSSGTFENIDRNRGRWADAALLGRVACDRWRIGPGVSGAATVPA